MPGHFANPSFLVHCSDEELALLVEQSDFGSFVAGRDLPLLRERLLRLERERGVTELHRRVSEKVLTAGARLVETPRYAGPLRGFALSPCGRHLAIASQRDESSLAGVVRIWELATGCVVDAVAFEGNVGGWRESSTLQWSSSGAWLGVTFDYASVGVMRAFAGTRPSFTVDVTRRWGSPPPWLVRNPEHVVNQGHQPAWCWSPDEKALFISTRGPDHARGCIVPFKEGAAVREDSEGVRWCPARLGGEHSKSYPLTWVRWSPDGSRVFGHCKDSCDWWERDSIRDDYYDFVSVTDVQSGNLQFASEDVTFPLAFSPDGAFLAHGRKRPVLADGCTGRPVAELSEQLAPCDLEAEAFVWSQDGRRLAVVSNLGGHPDDDDPLLPPLDHEHPAVFVFDEGRFRFHLKMESYWFAGTHHSDFHGWAWSPDGSMGACLVDARRIMVWELGAAPRLLRCIENVGRVVGLVWGADDTLVGLGVEEVAFWDVSDGHLRAHHSFAREPGHAPPPESWNPCPEGRAQGLPTKQGWAFTRVHPDGTVVCPHEAREQLAPRLMFAVEGRHAWPWRWAVGTRHTRLEDWPPHPVAGAPVAAPFAEHRLHVPESETAKQAEARRAEWGPLERYQVPTLPFWHYRADPVFTRGPTLCRDNLAPYVGRVMLVCVYDSLLRYYTATLLEVTADGLLLHAEAPGHRVTDRIRPFDSILWIGPAVPLRGPWEG
ncbi:hypothetical protein KYC5002_40665 [Archangium violaceum]|uniref:hypothetical protein n=1 Tax=Archangium violaceum TaxID=83451 RepID=UPI002B2B898A|nr:hypothetical protein KYC5002_40665 [Archangium gephyra]